MSLTPEQITKLMCPKRFPATSPEDAPRERLVVACINRFVAGPYCVLETSAPGEKRRWIADAEYRRLVQTGEWMTVLDER